MNGLKAQFTGNYRGMEFVQVLRSLATDQAATLPSLSKIATIALVLSSSSADWERGFSHMRLIKRYSRSILSSRTLDQLMFIAIEGPRRELFNFDSAIEAWGNMRNRRRLDVNKSQCSHQSCSVIIVRSQELRRYDKGISPHLMWWNYDNELDMIMN